MRERIDEIRADEVKIHVVAPSNAKYIGQFLEAFGPYPFPIVGDPKREAYREMGHHTMPKAKLLSMAALGFISGKVKNFIPKDSKQKAFVKSSMKTQDVYIQGGTWLFIDGDVAWKHIDNSPDDHATIDTILEQCQKQA